MTQTDIVVHALEEVVERFMTVLTVNITGELVEQTPIDTGWARANWISSIGTSFDVPATDDPDPSQVPGALIQQQASLILLAGYSIEAGPLFISNNVPYIVLLNEGSSRQAPSGYVQASIAKAITSLRRVTV